MPVAPTSITRPACRVFIQSLVIAHRFVLGALVRRGDLALVLPSSEIMAYRVTARITAGRGCGLYPKGSTPLSPLRRRQLRETLHDCSATRTGEVFVSKWLSDRIVEEAGRRIYESQQSRLSDQATFAAKRAWRSNDLPEKFWDSYVERTGSAFADQHRRRL
jgi:hypothetical protein